jgi:hypothetical protein
MAKTDDSWDLLLEDAIKGSTLQSCSVGRFLTDIGPEARKLVEAAMVHPKVSMRSLHRQLVQRGFENGYDRLVIHKAHKCSCFGFEKDSK